MKSFSFYLFIFFFSVFRKNRIFVKFYDFKNCVLSRFYIANPTYVHIFMAIGQEYREFRLFIKILFFFNFYFLIIFEFLKKCVSLRLCIANPTYVHIFMAIVQEYRQFRLFIKIQIFENFDLFLNFEFFFKFCLNGVCA